MSRFFSQSSRSRQLHEGSEWLERPWPAKWKMLHARNCARTSSLPVDDITGSSPCDGQRPPIISISLGAKEDVESLTRRRVSCIATTRTCLPLITNDILIQDSYTIPLS